LHLEGIFRNFGGLLYLLAWEDKLFVEYLAVAPTRVVCGADPGSASTVCNSGGDRAVFPATAEEVIVDAKDVLLLSGENVGILGHCVQFA
jgi:hypothetical protein